MPAVNPRREHACPRSPLIRDRFQEKPVGRGPFVGLAVSAIVLLAAHFFAGSWGWMGGLALAALDGLWLLLFWLFTDEARLQKRNGLAYVQLDASAFEPGDPLSLSIGSSRGLAGVSSLEVTLRCLDGFMEDRPIGEDGRTESTRVCYVVWEDHRAVELTTPPPDGEARIDVTLPVAGDFAGPWGTWIERSWEVEVGRPGGGLPLRFCVVVAPPK